MRKINFQRKILVPLTILAALMIASPSLIAKPLTSAEVIEAASDDDWRTPSQDEMIYMRIANTSSSDDMPNEVIFELATDFAPEHIANLKQLIAERFFDELAITRSHDNYVVQWGDPAAGTDDARSFGKAKTKLAPEFTRMTSDVSFNVVPSNDAYAESVGYSKGFAVASSADQLWLTHCYGTLGVGRGMEADSGNSAELYVVTGHAPRHLDKNVTLIGRVISGIEHLSSLPRGTGTLGFYEDKSQYIPIRNIRVGTELKESEQRQFQIFKTNTSTFQQYVAARTTRQHEWFLDSVGKIEVCNVGIPVREMPK